MKIDIVTLFPHVLESYLTESIMGRAQQAGAVQVSLCNLRDFAEDKHRVVDDYPFGGFGGMVLKPQPLFAAVESLRTERSFVVLLSPAGRRFTQGVARELSAKEHLVLLCGRYEGVDERVRTHLVNDEISIGDYVLTGGELPALVVTDSVVRLLPNILDRRVVKEESFMNGLLDFPQYTRPETFREMSVPDILLSGDHEKVRVWQRKQSLIRTLQRRPDLLQNLVLSKEEKRLLDDIKKELLEAKDEVRAHGKK